MYISLKLLCSLVQDFSGKIQPVFTYGSLLKTFPVKNSDFSMYDFSRETWLYFVQLSRWITGSTCLLTCLSSFSRKIPVFACGILLKTFPVKKCDFQCLTFPGEYLKFEVSILYFYDFSRKIHVVTTCIKCVKDIYPQSFNILCQMYSHPPP